MVLVMAGVKGPLMKMRAVMAAAVAMVVGLPLGAMALTNVSLSCLRRKSQTRWVYLPSRRRIRSTGVLRSTRFALTDHDCAS